MKLGVVILAAGQGTRMRSSLPKVLHRLANRPLLRHVVDTSNKLDPAQTLIVFGHGGEAVQQAFSSADGLSWVEQDQQLGTGHAVDQAIPALADVDQVLVLYGDVPLIQVETLSSLIQAAATTDLALLTVNLDNPTGYGRIVRGENGTVQRIVEQKDATAEELAISEINTGFCLQTKPGLQNWLSRLDNNNAQKEYYLTDIVELAVADGVDVQVAQPDDATEVMGVNDRSQLAQLERFYQRKQAEGLMRQGVALLDPQRFDLRGELTVGKDVEIDINVIIEGQVELGDGVRIGANSVVRNSIIANGVQILENCVIEDATIGKESVIGPFSRIRPGTKLAGNNKIGNFVEIKKSAIDQDSKVNHLSYVGDSLVGKNVNIGAGTITCNYDGANKFQTIIGDNVFIGSDSQLIAPVKIDAGATIGAGSTITSDAPADMLTLSRSKQISIKGWKRPAKKSKPRGKFTMCGIVGAIAQEDVTPVLLEGLKRLEYRGYDSAGVAILTAEGHLQRVRSVGKVAALKVLLDTSPVHGNLGIAHTRWATHGMPAERNAHPHMSGEQVAVVHNGIIENHRELRAQLESQGYRFTSETDTEVIAHLLASLMGGQSLVQLVRAAISKLVGAYALAVIDPEDSERLVVARAGSPLVVGVAENGNYIASDVFALLPVTQRFLFLEGGDIAEVRRDGVTVFDSEGHIAERPVQKSTLAALTADKGPYPHYMLKEIYEQPAVIAETLEGRIHKGRLLEESFGHEAKRLLDKADAVHIIACGTSYHAGLVAKYWLEETGVQCSVEVASEYRYRQVVVPKNALFVTISQSGETADTLAALRGAKEAGYLGSLCICNVPESSLVRESDVALMTRAGPEIGVASTKAFTTQLVALRLLTLALAKRKGMSQEREKELVDELHALPRQVEVVLRLSDAIRSMANGFAKKENALFLGRGTFYPIALEGALKLKEISYIHAEAYPAGELKHGPLALVDAEMPVVCALPDDPLLEKVLSNLQEVRARGGELFLFSDRTVSIDLDHYQNLTLDDICPSTAPIVYSIPLQLLSYHVAVLKGTDVDQPRNLAKSVTVE